MPDIYFDVDVALAEVPVNIFPLTDDTDFKTRETGVAYNAAGMDLVWNFVTSAGAYTQTGVTPTTAGDYDWTHQGDGMYSIEIPASGGASINNDTEGYGWFTGVATGVLPWRGPTIGFRSAALNDSLCDTNTTGVLAPTTAGRTLDVTAGGEAGIDWANIGSPTTTVDLSGTSTRALEPTTDGRTLDVTAGGNAGIDLDNIALTNSCGAFAIQASGTLSGTHSSTTADLGTNAPSSDMTGYTLFIPSRDFIRLVTSYNTGTGVATFDTTGATLANSDPWFLFATPQASTSLLAPVNVEQINGTTVLGDGSSGDKWRG